MPDKRPLVSEVRWALIAGCGSFLLYLFGYLVLRFHLAVLGVDTGLSTLDERYLFAGAQFLVYLLTSLPLAFLLVFIAHRLFKWTHFSFPQNPNGILIFGIALSTVLIQVVMRQCLPFTNLLLREDLPPPTWVHRLLVPGVRQPLYFTLVLAMTFVIARLLLKANRTVSRPSPFLNGALACLLLVQFLLLPVNFGVLIVDQEVPRVTTIDGKEPLDNNSVQAWRVWEDPASVTFFVRYVAAGHETRRALLTLDKKAILKTEISGYDYLSDLLRHPIPREGH